MIRLYPLNGDMMDGREAMHTHLYMQFALPAYYGRNLDALWDCLTEKEPGCIVLQRAERMNRAQLFPLLGLLLDLVRRDEGWQLQLSTGAPDCHGDAMPADAAVGGDCSACADREACAPAEADAPADAAPPDACADDCGCFDSEACCAGGADADGAANGCPFEA